ncbi:MAG: hypothetical protein KAY37_07515, partial [Phycisphaerae bacterium]|nr:hypothetical protein [Phycisphaerae bacterium]
MVREDTAQEQWHTCPVPTVTTGWKPVPHDEDTAQEQWHTCPVPAVTTGWKPVPHDEDTALELAVTYICGNRLAG